MSDRPALDHELCDHDSDRIDTAACEIDSAIAELENRGTFDNEEPVSEVAARLRAAWDVLSRHAAPPSEQVRIENALLRARPESFEEAAAVVRSESPSGRESSQTTEDVPACRYCGIALTRPDEATSADNRCRECKTEKAATTSRCCRAAVVYPNEIYPAIPYCTSCRQQCAPEPEQEIGMPGPEYDPDRDRGLYRKFDVRRTNPESQARHQDCDYFVLDLTHDRLAAEAIDAYERAADREGYHQLADDLRLKRAARTAARRGGR